MARNRIIYASQSVWANGNVLYRVQSLGTTTTFTNEDIFELGHLDIVDVVDDVPAVAVTLNTNDFGDLRTLAILAQLPPARAAMDATASGSNANLVSGSTYLHGVSVADFAVTCGNLTGITMWAPVQAECDLGTLANNIDQTLFLDEVYINSLEFSYTTGANATENYAAETDNKMWLLNDGAYVNYFETTLSGSSPYIDLVSLGFDNTSTIPTLSTGNLAFLRKASNGAPAITWYDDTENEMMNVEIEAGVAAATTTFVFDAATSRIYLPTGEPADDGRTVDDDDIVQIIFAADKYSEPMNTYFTLDTGENTSDLGALRQGQVEIFIVDGASDYAAWRLTGVTISADLTREPLTELGHLGPYDRPVTVPIPVTVTVDSTAGDLENWARFAGQTFDANLDDIDLNDLMAKDDLILMVKVYEQTDEEAGGTGANRKALTEAVIGDSPMVDGVLGAAYTSGAREYALKTIVVKNLKITDEGMTLDVGANATQTFGFRSTNDLFVVKGDLSPSLASALVRNAS
jgi:hypothetical protein